MFLKVFARDTNSSEEEFCAQGPLVGFNFTDCFELVWPDELHQGQKGDQEQLIDSFIDFLAGSPRAESCQ